MSNSILAGLDQAERMQLALQAGAANEAGSAIAYLKEAVARPDATAQAHYLLGAEYAQLGMFDRAAGEMEAALALDQTLYTARLQLGLLCLRSAASPGNCRLRNFLPPNSCQRYRCSSDWLTGGRSDYGA